MTVTTKKGTNKTKKNMITTRKGMNYSKKNIELQELPHIVARRRQMEEEQKVQQHTTILCNHTCTQTQKK